MGQNDMEQARNVFSISFIIHVLIAVLVIILAETVGLWFFYTWLNIPADRQSAAFVVYQISILTTVISIIQVPYNATIIAYEKMSFFAMLSVIESILKLGIVLLLPFIIFDKLIVYALLVCIAGIGILLVYKIYCNKTFETSRFKYCKNNELLKQLVEFSGWSIFGGIANVSSRYGTNILVNIFYGVTVNAAMGIAMQVNAAVYKFVDNFQTAFKPQIIKSYAAQDNEYFMRLIFRTSKISFYLLFFFVLPLFLNADFVLKLWLKNVPEYTVVFTQLILLFSLIDAISGPLWMSIQATGDIRKYQVIVSCFIFANLPLSLLFLWLGFSPAWVLIIKFGLNVLTFVWRVFFLKGRIKLPVMSFLKEVIIPVFAIVIISSVITVFASSFFVNWTKLLISCIISIVSIGGLVYLIGINAQERAAVKKWVEIKK
jgi:O-antigen/teichoic acid export membrane protein